MSKRLGTIPQVMAAYPFLTERWLRRIRAERRIRTYTVAGRVLFDFDELDRYIEASCVEES